MSVKDTGLVAKSYSRLYSPLEGSSSNKSGSSVVKSYLETHLPSSDRNEIDGEMKKIFSLQKQKGSRKKITNSKCRRKKDKYLSARERRQVGLDKLPKVGLQYSSFLALHNLWLGYIKEVLKLNHNNKPLILDDQVQLRACRADLHGALVKVTKAKTKSLVGLQGIVVMETRNTLQIITKKNNNNKLLIVPKQQACFTFAVEGHIVTLDGNSLCSKPSDRAVKKWKLKPPFNF